MDHPLRLDHTTFALRSWRTATIVVAGIAALELMLLVMLAGALVAKPEHRARHRRPGGDEDEDEDCDGEEEADDRCARGGDETGERFEGATREVGEGRDGSGVAAPEGHRARPERERTPGRGRRRGVPSQP